MMLFTVAIEAGAWLRDVVTHWQEYEVYHG
jgi:hypothetical protein